MLNRVEFKQFDMGDCRDLFERQSGRCAFSGEPLNDSAVLHHVVPAGHGGVRDAETNAFVSDWHRNGVLLNDECELDGGRESGAHLHIHGGSFKDGPFATHTAFEHSHGSDVAGHARWAAEGEAFVDARIYPKHDRPLAGGELPRFDRAEIEAAQDRPRLDHHQQR